MRKNSHDSCVDKSTRIIVRTSVVTAVGRTSVHAFVTIVEGSGMNINLHEFIESLSTDRSSLNDPLIEDGLVDCSSLIKRLLPLTHDGRALRSDIEYGVAEFTARLLNAVITGEDGRDDQVGAIVSLAIVLLRLGNVVADRYGDTSLEELLIDTLHQDDLRALAQEFAAVPMRLDKDGHPKPIPSLLEIFFAARPITKEMRDGYVQRRKLPYITTESDDLNQLQVEDFEVLEPNGPSGKCNLSDFDNLIADCCEGFGDYEDFYFDNPDRYHDE